MLLHYKKCSVGDLETLLWISRKTFSDAFEKENNPEDFQSYIDTAFRREAISDQLKNKKIHFYFVYVNDELAGYFKLNETGAQSDINDPETVELERIYVLEDFQGKNIGTRMLNEVTAIARKLEVNYLWLGVWEENRSAIRFYERYGFVKFGEHPYAVNTDIQTDWLMKLELEDLTAL